MGKKISKKKFGENKRHKQKIESRTGGTIREEEVAGHWTQNISQIDVRFQRAKATVLEKVPCVFLE